MDTNGSTSNSNNLRQLHKLSHNISKPIIRKPTFDSSQNDQQPSNPNFDHNQPRPPTLPARNQQQHQPLVYNINKNDFRDVVQRLTGSPAHERFSTPPPPPIQQPKPSSSRLQRIRPPPLDQISNRPPQLPQVTAIPPIPSNPINAAPVSDFSGFGRPAESPVSTYMRYLYSSMTNTDSSPKPFLGFSPLAPLLSPRFNNFTPQPPPPEPQSQVATMPPPMPQSQPQFQLPPSPAPFGFLNSPRSPYPLFSPSLLFSPTSGQLWFPQLPLSPTVPVPSLRGEASEPVRVEGNKERKTW